MIWGARPVSVRRARVADGPALAELHASAFRRGWSEAEFESLMVQPGVFCVLAHTSGTFGRQRPAGFLLYRMAGDEAEILTVAVSPASRRRGVATALMDESFRHMYRERIRSIHLEVEDTNDGAIALYRRADFRESGRRPGYYREGRAAPAGALVMLRELR